MRWRAYSKSVTVPSGAWYGGWPTPAANPCIDARARGHAVQVADKPSGRGTYLVAVNAILLLIRRPDLGDLPAVDVPAYAHGCDFRPIPDVALDKHAGRGRVMGRGVDHVLAEG